MIWPLHEAAARRRRRQWGPLESLAAALVGLLAAAGPGGAPAAAQQSIGSFVLSVEVLPAIELALPDGLQLSSDPVGTQGTALLTVRSNAPWQVALQAGSDGTGPLAGGGRLQWRAAGQAWQDLSVPVQYQAAQGTGEQGYQVAVEVRYTPSFDDLAGTYSRTINATATTVLP